MNKWIETNEEDESTWWPYDTRVLSCDADGWIVILKSTDNGFELDDGSEPGSWPTHWMPLPDRPITLGDFGPYPS